MGDKIPETQVRILHLEDSALDAELVAGWLEDDDILCSIQCVQTARECQAALSQGGFDLIIADHDLPGFDGLKALGMARELMPDAPFILFSGMIGEELAVECLKKGATDYVLKQRPQRLVAAVRQALAGAEERARRRQAETKLRRQAALIDKAQDAIMVTDMEERITFWNRSAERIYGWTEAEALGQRADRLLFKEMPLVKFSAAVKQIKSTGEWAGDLEQTRRDGTALVVESRWSLLRNEHGQPEAKLIINTDVTERKQLEAQFFRAQRLESIGALAGGIAHDLKNILTPILIGLQLLELESQDHEKNKRLLTMKRSAQRGAEMLKQILSFARGVGGQAAVLQIEPLVGEMAAFAKETFPPSICIQNRIEPDLPPIQGNATQLHQILLNLCINARDAMPGGGDLELAAKHVVLRNHVTNTEAEPVSGSFVELSVADTGSGMAPEQLQNLFQPFYTTKGEGKGTGLGLSTVKGIAKNHGGFVEVSSQLGRGTIFKVYLPTCSEDARATEEIPSANNGHKEEILAGTDKVLVAG